MTEHSIARGVAPDAAVSRAESAAVLAACSIASLAAIVWSWQHHAMLNYGDAVAHLNIARRVFDSHQPRFSELGSVWLPLPHILMIPFVQVYAWWANGIAGVVPSALAFLAACVGFYRLARRWMQPAAAVVALALFACNPNLLYLQTTAMTEPLFLCEMIWIVLWLVEWRASLDSDPAKARRLLGLLAAALVAAVFTRYDGWIMAFIAWTTVGIVLMRGRQLRARAFWIASAFVVAAPLAWFLYNSAAFGDWLYFARGPYSAAAIEARTAAPGLPPHPGWHNPWVAFLFFMKAAEMDAAARAWGNVMLVASLAGTACAWITARRHSIGLALLLLWLPVPFYAYSVAYGSVPIFLPVWWPHSWYNLRYGMELLPALALGVGFAVQCCVTLFRNLMPYGADRRGANAVSAVALVLVLLNALALLRERPLVYVEGTKNIHAHRPYEEQIPPVLRALLAQRPGGAVLMITSLDPEIVALTGIPLRQTINEGDLGIYRDALAEPAAHASIVVAFDGDEVDRAVHANPHGLTAYRRFQAPGQPAVTIYVADTHPAAALNKNATAVIASGKEIG